MKNYTVEIVESSRELSAKEKVMFKDLSDTFGIDAVTQENGELIIKPVAYVVLHIHNDKLEQPDYDKFVIVDDKNIRYSTGSESFWNSFKNIFVEMEGIDEEWSLKIFRKPSKNRAGKDFITCSVI